MRKVSPSKSVIKKIIMVFLSCVLFNYVTLLLNPSTVIYHDTAVTYVRCTLRNCHNKVETEYKMKAVLLKDVIESSSNQSINNYGGRIVAKRERPSFLNTRGLTGKRMIMGMVNMKGDDLTDWNALGKTVHVSFEAVSDSIEWKHLFPGWTKGEEAMQGKLCPEIPMPDYEKYGYMDMIVVNIPCKYKAKGWRRDVFRLQLHLIAANLLVRRGRKRVNMRPKVVVLSKCQPMVEIFGCDDLLVNDGEWWYYEPCMKKLEQKVYLPVGSCNLALPLWDKDIDESNIKEIEIIKSRGKPRKLEAYATVVHSSEDYICGAILLAHSLLRTGTNRDLILLIDASISVAKRDALASAGWTIRIIERIRNPGAKKHTYNEYNYSKFRLWQLTEYDKIIFIDADILILRNLDHLFLLPQMTAVRNDNAIFNSGIMVIEPSNCIFEHFMQQTKEIISYNGGDQGFLNEIFVYWHRLPIHFNYFKTFASNTADQINKKNLLFNADPPYLYAIHYFGRKPWWCYRDYDCNWDIGNQRVYANDVAHQRWWKLYDTIDESLKNHCKLTPRRKEHLRWNRVQAKEMGLADQHWAMNVTDVRDSM